MSTENRDAGRNERGSTADGERHGEMPTDGPIGRPTVDPANDGGVRG